MLVEFREKNCGFALLPPLFLSIIRSIQEVARSKSDNFFAICIFGDVITNRHMLVEFREKNCGFALLPPLFLSIIRSIQEVARSKSDNFFAICIFGDVITNRHMLVEFREKNCGFALLPPLFLSIIRSIQEVARSKSDNFFAICIFGDVITNCPGGDGRVLPGPGPKIY